MSESHTSATGRGSRTRAAVTRRRVITAGLTGAAAVSGTAAALRPMLAADQPETRVDAAPEAAVPLFDEVYRGRRIQGFPDSGEDGVSITVDGTPLPVMRRVDGSWISTANHFQPYTTPLATARGAVDVIGRARLSAAAAAEHHH
jgi:tyrosinase co-factor MelC1